MNVHIHCGFWCFKAQPAWQNSFHNMELTHLDRQGKAVLIHQFLEAEWGRKSRHASVVSLAAVQQAVEVGRLAIWVDQLDNGAALR